MVDEDFYRKRVAYKFNWGAFGGLQNLEQFSWEIKVGFEGRSSERGIFNAGEIWVQGEAELGVD